MTWGFAFRFIRVGWGAPGSKIRRNHLQPRMQNHSTAFTLDRLRF